MFGAGEHQKQTEQEFLDQQKNKSLKFEGLKCFWTCRALGEGHKGPDCQLTQELGGSSLPP